MQTQRKSSSSSSGRTQGSAGQSGKLLAGMLVGIIVATAVLVGAFMFFGNRSSTFSNLGQLTQAQDSSSATEVLTPGIDNGSSAPTVPVELSAPVSKVQNGVAPAASAALETAPAKPTPNQKAEDGEEFDFYKILPGKLDAVPGEKSAPATPGDSSAPKQSFLQLGAFQNEVEADNFKAKLALMGVEAAIQSSNLPDGGLLHRVRVGPFGNDAQLKRTRDQLKASGIDSIVIHPK